MNRLGNTLILYVPAILAIIQAPVHSRERQSIDDGWKFIHSDSLQAENPGFDDSQWRTVDLPHDWSIEYPVDKEAPTGGSGGYAETGVGWYRKVISFDENPEGKTVWLEFDGIYMNSDVWMNGHHLGNHPCGYTSFYYDVSEFLKKGKNVIAVKVDNSRQPNSRWYSGSGIYRHVWLTVAEPVHISHWGTVITSSVDSSSGAAAVMIRTTVENSSRSSQQYTLATMILDPEGSDTDDHRETFRAAAGSHSVISQDIQIRNPRLWTPDKPVLYTVVQEIRNGNHVIDHMETVFGIRSIAYDVDRGFFLNGDPVKMKGVNLHHDGGCVGAAVPERVWERRLEILKSMGCNAIRTSHNPPAPEFLDLCDRIGFLVMDEAFDEWRIGKREYAYHLYFDAWGEKDLISMIQRDRNHPSIVLWSVGNEIPEQKSEDGYLLLERLQDICHEEDPTRPVTLGCDNIAADGGSTTLPFLEALDIVGYNYVDRWHARRELYFSIDRHLHPAWKMVGTESVSLSGIRGEYRPGEDPSIIQFRMPRNLIRGQELWKTVSLNDYVIGDFMWTGIDYLGEAFWPHKHASAGAIDICGFPKDAYYFYKSQWQEAPVLHLFPHWNWPEREGQIMPVFCYTNCTEVELFVNEKSYGIKRIEFPRQGNSGSWYQYEHPKVASTTADLFLAWDVPYEPGVLYAEGKRGGKVVCTQEIRTTGEPAAICLNVDRPAIRPDRQDLAHVTVEIVDEAGLVVPTANNLLQFTVSGAGRLIAVDNGDPKDHDSYQLDKRHGFHGLCLALVQPDGTGGKIHVTVTSEGLIPASAEVETKY
jgi:beta-galactosidase